MSRAVDFDLHGLAGVRLLGAGDADAAAVGRQLGLPETALRREPDIEIEFVEALTTGPLRYLGLDEAGFTDDAFIVLRSRYKSAARVRIPLADVGRGCRIVCERGIARIPLLTSILNVVVLGNGALPLHAAAFVYNGTGVVATGWSKGGKTETLLACMAHGADYVGDEWIYLTADGARMYGIPEPVRLWHWHLASLPRYRAAVSGGDRARLRVVGALDRLLGRATANGARHRSRAARTANRLRPLLGRQLCVDLPPRRLFGDDACPMQGTPQRILFVESHEAPEITVEPIEPAEIARRMVFSLQEEQARLMSLYWKYRFAFPAASNELIERSRDLQGAALRKALKGKVAWRVAHPYPVELEALFEAVRPLCGETS